MFSQNLMYVGVHAVITRAFGLCTNSDGRQGANRKRTVRRTQPLSYGGSRTSAAAAAAPFVRAATHFDATSRRARIDLQQRPRSPNRDSKAIYGWPCMSAKGPQRSIGLIAGWGPSNWIVRYGTGGGFMVVVVFAMNIPIVFLFKIKYVRFNTRWSH